MYSDFHVAADWSYTSPMSVKIIYKLFTEPGYASNHKIIDPHKYIFIYTMEGVGFFMVDDIQIMATPNTLVIINAKQSLHYHCASDKWNFWLIEFKTPQLLFAPNKIYPLILDKTDLTLCAAALDALKQEHLLHTGALFQALYYSAYRKTQETVTVQKHKLLRSALLYMQENISHFSVEDLCSYLNLAERTLRNIFVQNLGTSPKKYFEFLRLERSKQYLENTSLSVAMIAAELGFSNPGHFSTAFRCEYGVTPKRYRLTFSVNPDTAGPGG